MEKTRMPSNFLAFMLQLVELKIADPRISREKQIIGNNLVDHWSMSGNHIGMFGGRRMEYWIEV